MGCCASCFYYTGRNDYDDYEQIHYETARQRILQLYKEQYAREEAEGIIVLPTQTRVSYIDLEKVRTVFPPIPVRSTPPSPLLSK
jgi:hypothetical protein